MRMRLFLLMAVAMFGLRGVWAQEPQSAPAPPTTVWRNTYRNWTRHTGAAQEASVLIHVVDAGGRVLRSGNGFVVRCDGFVLVPETLLPRGGNMGDKILVSVAQAEGETLTEPLVAIAPPRFYGKKTDYVLIKVNDHHLPCPPLLDSINVREGAKVKVVWADGQENPSVKIKTQSVEATIGPASDDTMHFSLGIAGPSRPSTGASVVDAGSGASLGIVTKVPAPGSSGSIWFSPYTYLNYVTNEIGLRNDAREDEDAPGDMVRVPGGPIALSGDVLGHYRLFYKTTVACIPPFWIDRNPVTIGQYRDWLGKVLAPYQPEGWLKDNEVRTQTRRSDLAVTGMLTQDAARYAVAQKKRLVTAVEWLKASEYDDDSWYKEYLSKLTATQIALVGIDRAKQEAFSAYIRDTQVTRIQQGAKSAMSSVNPASFAGTLWIDTEEIRLLNEKQRELYQKWFEKYWFASQNPPVNFYEEDKSNHNVRNIWLGPPEIVLPNLARRTMETAWKPGQAFVDPYLSLFTRTYDKITEIFANVSQGDMDDVFVTFFPQPNGRPLMITVPGKGTTTGFNYVARTQVPQAFVAPGKTI